MAFENPEETRAFAETQKLICDCQNRGIKSELLFAKKEFFLKK
jgi:hypothetical protein